MRRKRNYWDKESSFSAALEFTNKRDFKREYAGAYEYLRKNKLFDESCAHMKTLINLNKIKWTYEKCRECAQNFECVSDFRKTFERAYKIAQKNGWTGDICSHMKSNTKFRFWNIEKCRIEAKKYNTRIEFYKGSPGAYAAANRNSWMNDICIHMGVPYSSSIIWDYETCKEIAKQYTYRKEFQKNNIKAYAAALYSGWLDDICSHMIYKKLPNNYWNNFENCKSEALKYQYKKDFIRSSQHAYNVSLRLGWIEKICSHMIVVGDRYNKCIYSYEFPDKHVYVGLTYNIDVRKKSRNKNKTDAVVIHKTKTGLVPIFKQLTEYLAVDVAVKLEGKFLKIYKRWMDTVK